MNLHRRSLLKLGAGALLVPAQTIAEGLPPSPSAPPAGRADHTIRIGTGLIELGADTIVSTKLYNGQFPGPLLRFTEGKRAVVDVYNDTDTPELVHWHGQAIPADVDGAAEEGSPFIPPHGMRRISFVPAGVGCRYYHSHVSAAGDLSAGLYSGQAGPVFIEPRRHAGAYDREIFLTLKEFGPYLTRTEMPREFLAPDTEMSDLRATAQAALERAAQQGLRQGYEVAYNFFSINGRMLGEGEPIRVKAGERVLFHVLNASATEIRSLALPGHSFKVVALDGNPVPTPADVPVLWIGTAERVSAIVEMKTPGVWVLGDLMDEDREHGMGIVVEYAGRDGAPQWAAPAAFRWDYRLFAKPDAAWRQPEKTVDLIFAAHPGARGGFDEFTINGVPFSMERMEPMFKFERGRRYQLHMRNATDDVHPIHLHRHSFELTSIAGHITGGVIKDVAMIGAFQEMTVDFTADQPGLSLFHCHMQHHMDAGFMALFHCE